MNKSKVVSLEELQHIFHTLMQAKQNYKDTGEILKIWQERFDNLTNRTSAKVLAEFTRTEAFTDHII